MTNHIPYVCPPDAHDHDLGRSCPYCDGNLVLCTVCGGCEIELATECPGVKMTEEQRIAVRDGQADFINGGWVRKNLNTV